jgi:hypothetical protein
MNLQLTEQEKKDFQSKYRSKIEDVRGPRVRKKKQTNETK